MESPRLYLASQSPRRGELLEQIAIPYARLNTAVDETPLPAEAPAQYVQRLARVKAMAGWQQVVAERWARLPVLGADTAVVLHGSILGKPRDRTDALHMLASLSGHCHQVMTAVCLYDGGFDRTVLSISDVCFRAIGMDECVRYWDTGEPVDKAGGYAIQGRGAVFVEQLRGSYSGVVGLPLLETSQLLAAWESATAGMR